MEKEVFNGIVSNPLIMSGEAIIKGTRMPVALVIGRLAGGMSVAEIMDEYDLSEEEIRVALAYAENLVMQQDRYVTQS